MKLPTDKRIVELYLLRVLPAEIQLKVEQAFDAHPQVQEWFLEYGELPAHVELEEDSVVPEFAMDCMLPAERPWQG